MDVSQSMDQSNIAMGKEIKINKNNDTKDTSRNMQRDSDQSKSHGVLNKPFDEALEFSQSGSDDSVDTRQSEKKGKVVIKPTQSENMGAKPTGPSSSNIPNQKLGSVPLQQSQNNAPKQSSQQVRIYLSYHCIL